MKRYICMAIAAIFMCALTLHAEDKTANIKFEKNNHNFGVIQEKDGPVTCEFEFTNTGTGNLVITDATAQCGCTRPQYPKKPIAPGKKGTIKVTYNPAGVRGSFDKRITVRCNGKTQKVYLKIKGNVVPANNN